MKVTKITKLPAYLRGLREDLIKLNKVIQELNYKVEVNTENIEKLSTSVAAEQSQVGDLTSDLKKQVEQLRLRNTELEHQVLVKKETAVTSTRAATPSETELFADNHNLDAFYLELENRFRGSETEIQDKQKPYIKLFKEAKVDHTLPIADIGCGRGEFLNLLSKNGLKAIGIDLNESMVKRAQEKGFDAVNDDAIGYLLKQPSNSLAGVTAFQLAEHLPFEVLLTLIAESYRCLAKGGILLLETPNPENLSVGAFTFHYDPSHIKPLPPAILQFAAEFKGFPRAAIMRMQPALTDKEIANATSDKTLQEVLAKLYGSRDYALVAYK